MGSIEKPIEREGEDLQLLVEKCGNRYHVLNNKNSSDETRIKDLLEKIDETAICNMETANKCTASSSVACTGSPKVFVPPRSCQSMVSGQPNSDAQYLSELRIVLMGYKGAGKSSSGNIILKSEEFDLKRSVQCVKRQREVADRHITVIETPGWWITEPVDQSPQILKQEILLGVSLCPPGPHAVLLVIRADTRFTNSERKVFQGYVDLLGERVWSHTIVLFTHGDFLGDTSIEKHIEREGEDLQLLMEKCGNRYHVLNNKNSSDETHIKDLLEKIDETVTQNNGCHFEIDREILQEVEERRRAIWRVRSDRRPNTNKTTAVCTRSPKVFVPAKACQSLANNTPNRPDTNKGLASKSVFYRGSPKVCVPARVCHSMVPDHPNMSTKWISTGNLANTKRLMFRGSASSVSSGYGSSLSLSESVNDLQKNERAKEHL